MTPETERAEWNARASSMEAARHEGWSDPATWNTGIVRHLAMIVPAIEGASPVFDLGCGPGRLTIALEMLCRPIVIGVDISSNMIECARRRAVSSAAQFIQCDGRTLPLEDDGFDAGYSVTVFQHLPPEGVRSYLEEAYRVLRKGGVFRFQYVVGEERGDWNYQYLGSEMMKMCQDAGFDATSERDPWQHNWRWVSATK